MYVCEKERLENCLYSLGDSSTCIKPISDLLELLLFLASVTKQASKSNKIT